MFLHNSTHRVVLVICMCVGMYLYIYIYVCMYVCMYVYIYRFDVYVCGCVCVGTYVHRHMCIYIYMCMHIMSVRFRMCMYTTVYFCVKPVPEFLLWYGVRDRQMGGVLARWSYQMSRQTSRTSQSWIIVSLRSSIVAIFRAAALAMELYPERD